MLKLKKRIICAALAFALFNPHPSIGSSSLDADDPIIRGDQKLKTLFKENKRIRRELAAEISRNPWAFDSFLAENLALLAKEEHESIMKGILRCSVYLLKDSVLEVDLYYAEHTGYLEKFSSHSDPSIRQTACIVRATLLSRTEKYAADKTGLFAEAEALLGEGRSSQSPFIKYKSYLALISAAEDCENIECAFAIAQQGLTSYGLKFHKALASIKTSNANTEKEYVIRRRSALEALSKEGNQKQQRKALLSLAFSYSNPSLKETEFYALDKTLRICNPIFQQCLHDHATTQTNFSMFRDFGIGEKPTSCDYLQDLSTLAYLYAYRSNNDHGEVSKAIHIYKILQNYEQYEESSFDNLINIYRNGPITIISPLTALDMWEKKLARAATGSPYYLHLLQRISLFCQTTGWYGAERSYRLRLVQLLEGQPDSQIHELNQVLKSSLRDEVPERFLEIRNAARKILETPLSLPLRLKSLGILYEVYKKYPGFAAPGEIGDIYNEISRPMLVPYVESGGAERAGEGTSRR